MKMIWVGVLPGALAGFAGAIIAVLLMSQTRASDHLGELAWKARDGRVRFRVEDCDDGSVRMVLLDSTGREGLTLGVTDQMAWLRVGPAGDTHIQLTGLRHTAKLEIADRNELAVLVEGGDNRVRLVELRDALGPRARLTVNDSPLGGSCSSLEFLPAERGRTMWSRIGWYDRTGGEVSILNSDGSLTSLRER